MSETKLSEQETTVRKSFPWLRGSEATEQLWETFSIVVLVCFGWLVGFFKNLREGKKALWKTAMESSLRDLPTSVYHSAVQPVTEFQVEREDQLATELQVESQPAKFFR